MLQVFRRHVARVCSKCFISFQTYVCKSFLFGCCIVSHMLQEYVPMVSTVSVLCCSKCFHVASVLSGCFICFTHMFQMYVPCFNCFRRMLHLSVSCSEVCSESNRGKRQARCWWSGCVACLSLADDGMLVLILAPGSRPRGERGGSWEGAAEAATGRGTCAGRGEAIKGRLRERPEAPDVRALATYLDWEP
jgi:hypothetical protein